eukprot:1154587-Pelagomonas_calceolata.AAC.3
MKSLSGGACPCVVRNYRMLAVSGTLYRLYANVLRKGASGGRVAGRAEVDTRRRRVRASPGMADNPPDPH